MAKRLDLANVETLGDDLTRDGFRIGLIDQRSCVSRYIPALGVGLHFRDEPRAAFLRPIRSPGRGE